MSSPAKPTALGVFQTLLASLLTNNDINPRVRDLVILAANPSDDAVPSIATTVSPRLLDLVKDVAVPIPDSLALTEFTDRDFKITSIHGKHNHRVYMAPASASRLLAEIRAYAISLGGISVEVYMAQLSTKTAALCAAEVPPPVFLFVQEEQGVQADADAGEGKAEDEDAPDDEALGEVEALPTTIAGHYKEYYELLKVDLLPILGVNTGTPEARCIETLQDQFGKFDKMSFRRADALHRLFGTHIVQIASCQTAYGGLGKLRLAAARISDPVAKSVQLGTIAVQMALYRNQISNGIVGLHLSLTTFFRSGYRSPTARWLLTGKGSKPRIGDAPAGGSGSSATTLRGRK